MLTGAVPRDFPEDQDRWLVVLESAPVPILERTIKNKIAKKPAKVIDDALADGEKIPFPTVQTFKEALEDAL